MPLYSATTQRCVPGILPEVRVMSSRTGDLLAVNGNSVRSGCDTLSDAARIYETCPVLLFALFWPTPFAYDR